MSVERLIEFDRELKQGAPGFIRQVMVNRSEMHVGYLVSFELLFQQHVSNEEVEKDPRRAAAKFWVELQEKIRTGFGDDAP